MNQLTIHKENIVLVKKDKTISYITEEDAEKIACAMANVIEYIWLSTETISTKLIANIIGHDQYVASRGGETIKYRDFTGFTDRNVVDRKMAISGIIEGIKKHIAAGNQGTENPEKLLKIFSEKLLHT